MSGLMQKLALRMDAAFNAKHIAGLREGWAARIRDDVKFHETEHVVFRYREAAGPDGAKTLVFCADPPVSLEQYDELLGLASQDFRVIVFELPGMGFSPSKRAFRFGFEQTNDNIAAFLRAIAGDGAVLAFGCGAGLGAIDIARRFPELVSALVLIQVADVAAFARWKAARDPKQLLAKPVIGQLALRRMGRERMPVWFRLALGRKDHEHRFCSCSGEAMDEGALWSLASAFQVYLRDDLDLPPVAQPTLALWGETDRSHPREHWTSTANLAENVEQHRFPELGHFPELQEPATVFPVIRDWLVDKS